MPDETSSRDLPLAQVRVMQMITGALVAGVLGFLAVVLVIQQQQAQAGQPPLQTAIISLVAAGGFVVMFGVWLILPPTLIRQGLAQIAGKPADPPNETRTLLALKQTTHIVACALLEGPAFFALTAYMVERQPYTLGIALACVLLILLSFPTQERMQRWLDEQLDRLDNLRRGD